MEFAQKWTSSPRDLSRLRLRHVPLILMYHGVGQVSQDPYDLCVTPARFCEQMTWLAERGLRGVSINTLVAAMRAGHERGLVGLTFDDGYVNVLEHAVPELLRYDFTATMFIVSGRLGRTNEWDGEPVWPRMSAQQVAEVAAAGMEIGSHTVTHTRLRGLGAHRLRAEISESRSKLSELIGRPIHGFAYPYGNMDASARRAVQDAGYDYACSVVTPIANLGIMALPRIVFGQRDGSARMEAKRIIFRGHTAAKGAWMTISDNPLVQGVKRPLSAVARLPASKDKSHPLALTNKEVKEVMICVVRPAELSSADIDSWRSMQSSAPSFTNPFLSPEFAIIVGELRPNVRVAVLSEGSSIVGFFPFERHRSGAGTPIAAGLTDCQGLVHAPGVQWDARELLRACRLSVWQFDHLVEGQRPFDRYCTTIRPSPFMDLSDGFDSYHDKLASRSPQFCRNLERKERKLGRETGHLRFVPDSHDESAFRALLTWKSIQYRQTGQVDIFARPWVADLIEALFSYRSDSFSGLLSVLYVDEAPIAAHFGLRGGEILAHWFPAYDVRFSKYSPGLILHMRMAEFTPSVGVRIIDMGTGIQRYKEELKSGEIFVGTGIVTTKSFLAATHRAGIIGSQRVIKAIKQNPTLFHAAGWLRRTYRSARNSRIRASQPVLFPPLRLQVVSA